MAKRQHSVSLSFVLLRFGTAMLGSMLLCCAVWYTVTVLLQNNGIIYQGGVSNRQVEQLLAGEPKAFVQPDENFLAEYALFSPGGQALASNVEGKKLEALAGCYREGAGEDRVVRHVYEDGTTVVIRWHYRAEFADPVLRRVLPPAEYLSLGALGAAWLLCLLCSTLWLRRRLADRLMLFSEVSGRIAAQDLDFEVPQAGIREFDRALDAMEQMRRALYASLSSQWAAQQEREAQIAALAHDLKTPLTLIGGNAELLLEEELSARSRKLVESIASSGSRAGRYVACLLETSAGADEAFESVSLPVLFDELSQSAEAVAEAGGISLKTRNDLKGTAKVQKERLLRALGNVVQNAVEHTPAGGCVYLEGCMAEDGWQVVVRDEGPGFSEAALRHGTQRLWRGAPARGADGHHGLGLWFAAQVAEAHGGALKLSNRDTGGVAAVRFGRDAEESQSGVQSL